MILSLGCRLFTLMTSQSPASAATVSLTRVVYFSSRPLNCSFVGFFLFEFNLIANTLDFSTIIYDERVVEEDCDERIAETKVTLSLMLERGVNNVRGAQYCEPTLYEGERLEHVIKDIGHHLGMNYAEVRQKLGLDPSIRPAPVAPSRVVVQDGSAGDRFQGQRRLNPSHCAICQKSKTPDPDKPLCYQCWQSQNVVGPYPVIKKQRKTDSYHCAECGKQKSPDQSKPLCYECWSAMDSDSDDDDDDDDESEDDDY